ncbi:hypothetical protein K7X08_029343 [Anisodus acutangulus]|uniref:Glucose-methanol-choline oxidoreductase N-terminal domain-containing protein n=1 Tax=Anisodus acutangulus TaxID=402998 RepID=A0A9Q1QUN3_9SOLA|nr:hypothetical protein K7X08_029343 [Anisodus acutangulus]
MHQETTAPEVSQYDYIIIGGGTAGCPLAGMLFQNYNVFLLERGGSPYGNPNITFLSAFGSALSDLSPNSPSQRFISEDGVINASARFGRRKLLKRGILLTHGNEIREECGMGWDGKLVNESYVWVENKVAFQPPVRQWQSAVHYGLVESGVMPYNGFTYDHINGTKIGGTIFYNDGRRHTAADLLEYANPSGITLLLHASVHKILFKTRGVSRPVARGVVFRDALGKKHKAYLRGGEMNEVIVSAGALGSPQMLMLSGPNVGQGMMDNPMNAIFVPSPVPVEVSLIQVVGITHFGSYIEAASGENFGGDHSTRSDYGMFSPKIGQVSTVPPKQRTPEALEKAINSMSALDDAAFKGGFILEKIMGPLSTGHLVLRTRNPNDNPSVTFNYFKVQTARGFTKMC